jgi:hypothetical protein
VILKDKNDGTAAQQIQEAAEKKEEAAEISGEGEAAEENSEEQSGTAEKVMSKVMEKEEEKAEIKIDEKVENATKTLTAKAAAAEKVKKEAHDAEAKLEKTMSKDEDKDIKELEELKTSQAKEKAEKQEIEKKKEMSEVQKVADKVGELTGEGTKNALLKADDAVQKMEATISAKPAGATCPKDMRKCTGDEGVTMVGRDPENDCHFKPCPEGLEEAVEELKDEEAVAGGGEAMEKKTDNDEKKEDKLKICPEDTKMCPNGEPVGRDPANDCNFVPCTPVLKVGNKEEGAATGAAGAQQGGSEAAKQPIICPTDAKVCEGTGKVVSRDPMNNCEWKPCEDKDSVKPPKMCEEPAFLNQQDCTCPKKTHKKCIVNKGTKSEGPGCCEKEPEEKKIDDAEATMEKNIQIAQ